MQLVINGRVVYEPSPKQQLFHTCPARFVLYGGAAGGGKALSIDTPIPTPSGHTPMGSLSVGDVVFDEDGHHTSVVWASEVFTEPTYRVTFDDGQTITAGERHQWWTFTDTDRSAAFKRTDAYRARRRKSRLSRGTGKRPDVAERNRANTPPVMPTPKGCVRTTKEIAETLTVRHGTRTNHAVPLVPAWDCAERELLVDPYVLGAWLGDGSKSSGVISGIDDGVFDHIVSAGYEVRRLARHDVRSVIGLITQLRTLGVYENKHIPHAYLWSSQAQRLSLLQGLMDTDGYCAADGKCEFWNTNKVLSEGVRHLAHSLGIKTFWYERRATLNGNDCGPKYGVCWTSTVPVFRLKRKLDRLPTTLRSSQRFRFIVSCEPIARQPLRCIQVSTPSSLYLCGAAGIPTHNSHALRWHGHMSCLQVPKLRVLLLRRNIPDLKRTHLKLVPMEAEDQLGAKYYASEMTVKYQNGSTFEFGHCQDDQAVAIYLSAEYDLILFDELVTFTEYQYKMISSRCRTTIPGVKPRVLAGTNPGGPESYWVRRYWVDRDIEPDEDPTYNPEDYAYIPATLDDNPHINQEEYERMLMRLPPDLARAYRHGDWDVYQGQFFPEFRKSLHVVELPPQPPHLKRYCGMDWGYAAEGVVLWGVVLPDGQLYIEDELVFNGPRAKTLRVAHEVATMVKERNVARGLSSKIIYADPSIFKHSGHTGETISETFGRYGVALTPANNDRVMGWAKVRAWLRPMPPHPDIPQRPWMIIHPRCSYLIRTIPQLVMDGTNPEDCDTDGPDHACVAASTRVLTRRGEVPITALTCEDDVLTREGFKRVLGVACTRDVADVFDVEFSDGRTVRATPDHSFWVDGQWSRADTLRYGNMALCAIENRDAITPTSTVQPGSGGEKPMGRFRVGTTSTTRTATPPITPSTTWSAWMRSRISRITHATARLVPSLKPRVRQRLRGIAQTWAEPGIAFMARWYGSNGFQWCADAPSATASSATSRCTPSSATLTARPPLADAAALMMWNGSADTVVMPSWPTNTPAPSSVPVSALSVIAVRPAGREPVYNLTIDTCHEFYANGVLVKNCDALRYMIAGRPSPTKEITAQEFPRDSIGYLKQSVMGRSTPPLLGARNVRRNARF